MPKFSIYKVGGSVRDRLLGMPSNDNDYVVVGAQVNDLVDLGYTPVGKDFPVFLHPITHEAYALARSEKKSGVGYKGFTFYTSPNITLEEDLKRRDLTINAIAEDEKGNLIDPYNGLIDLKNKIIRHVSSSFSDDPLRVIRVARFAERYGFNIAPETIALMRDICKQPAELKSLSQERIRIEINKTLEYNHIVNFFNILNNCGALEHILTEFKSVTTNTKIAANIQQYITKCNEQFNTATSSKYKPILLYYAITEALTLEEALSTINHSILATKSKQLLTIIIKIYPLLASFTELIDSNNIPMLLNIFNNISPTKDINKFNQLYSIISTISQVKQEHENISNAFKFINSINKIFKQIDYKNILSKNNGKNVKEIVYNKKVEIISKYILEHKNDTLNPVSK